MLIRDGATLVRSAIYEDVLEATGISEAEPSETPPARKPENRQPFVPDITNLHQQILERLGPKPGARGSA